MGFISKSKLIKKSKKQPKKLFLKDRYIYKVEYEDYNIIDSITFKIQRVPIIHSPEWFLIE